MTEAQHPGDPQLDALMKLMGTVADEVKQQQKKEQAAGRTTESSPTPPQQSFDATAAAPAVAPAEMPTSVHRPPSSEEVAASAPETTPRPQEAASGPTTDLPTVAEAEPAVAPPVPASEPPVPPATDTKEQSEGTTEATIDGGTSASTPNVGAQPDKEKKLSGLVKLTQFLGHEEEEEQATGAGPTPAAPVTGAEPVAVEPPQVAIPESPVAPTAAPESEPQATGETKSINPLDIGREKTVDGKRYRVYTPQELKQLVTFYEHCSYIPGSPLPPGVEDWSLSYSFDAPESLKSVLPGHGFIAQLKVTAVPANPNRLETNLTYTRTDRTKVYSIDVDGSSFAPVAVSTSFFRTSESSMTDEDNTTLAPYISIVQNILIGQDLTSIERSSDWTLSLQNGIELLGGLKSDMMVQFKDRSGKSHHYMFDDTDPSMFLENPYSRDPADHKKVTELRLPLPDEEIPDVAAADASPDAAAGLASPGTTDADSSHQTEGVPLAEPTADSSGVAPTVEAPSVQPTSEASAMKEQKPVIDFERARTLIRSLADARAELQQLESELSSDES